MLVHHLEKLRVFLAVAQDASMARASRKLLISQPAVSKSIRNLEEAIGHHLFQRNRGDLSLTPAGKRLLEFAQVLFLQVEDLEQSLSHLDELSGVLKVGTYESLGDAIWPDVLEGLRRSYPNLLVYLETEGGGSIWSKLTAGSLEMVVDAEPEPLPSFVSKVLYKDEFQVFRSTDRRKLLEESPLPFAYVETARDRKKFSIRDHLAARGIDHRLIYGVQSFTFVRALTLKGLCYGVLPTRIAASDLNGRRLEPFIWNGKPVHFGEHRICATYAEHFQNNQRIKAVIEAFRMLIDKQNLVRRI